MYSYVRLLVGGYIFSGFTPLFNVVISDSYQWVLEKNGNQAISILMVFIGRNAPSVVKKFSS